MKQALASYERYSTGTPIGPLDGVPCVIKDQIMVQGLRSRDGLPFIDTLSVKDAEIVKKLKAQGRVQKFSDSMTNIGMIGSKD